jgi:hypothetical protein
MEADTYEVNPREFSPLSQHILAAAAADFMECCSRTQRNDSSASVEPVLSIQKPEASLALQTYLPKEWQVCVMYVCTYVRTHVCVCVWMNGCMYVYMYVCVTSTMEHTWYPQDRDLHRKDGVL